MWVEQESPERRVLGPLCRIEALAQLRILRPDSHRDVVSHPSGGIVRNSRRSGTVARGEVPRHGSQTPSATMSTMAAGG